MLRKDSTRAVFVVVFRPRGLAWDSKKSSMTTCKSIGDIRKFAIYRDLAPSPVAKIHCQPASPKGLHIISHVQLGAFVNGCVLNGSHYFGIIMTFVYIAITPGGLKCLNVYITHYHLRRSHVDSYVNYGNRRLAKTFIAHLPVSRLEFLVEGNVRGER